MENQSYGAVRIESAKFGKRGVLGTCLLFFFSFGLSCLIGAYGPEVFKTSSGVSSLRINRTTANSIWTGHLINLVPENQLLWLSSRIQRPKSIPSGKKFSYTQKIDVSVWGTNEPYVQHQHFNASSSTTHELVHAREASRTITFQAGSEYCDFFTIANFHSVNYKNYRVTVEFESPGELIDEAGGATSEDQSMYTEFDVTYVNADYTKFEIRWKYFFVCVTLMVMFFPKLISASGSCGKSRALSSFSLVFEGFFCKLCGTSRQIWSYQQKWITALLTLLLFFNDPLIYFEINNDRVGGEILGGIYIGCMALFICTLMLFWLCALDETRKSGSMSRGGKTSAVRKHGPKVAFMVAFWIYLVVTYTWVRLQQHDDPSYEAAEEGDKYVGATVCLALFMVVYMLWFMVYVCLSLAAIKNLPPPFLFVFVITFFTFVATCVGLFIAAMYPVPSAPLDFLGMYSLYNLYVWTLAFVYAPLQSGNGTYGQDFHVSMDSMESGGETEGTMMAGGDDAIDDMQL